MGMVLDRRRVYLSIFAQETQFLVGFYENHVIDIDLFV